MCVTGCVLYCRARSFVSRFVDHGLFKGGLIPVREMRVRCVYLGALVRSAGESLTGWVVSRSCWLTRTWGGILFFGLSVVCDEVFEIVRG